MKNVIIGTAGHVDHGKTCLIKALTGMDTDRLKEEKQRGITIELGFAYLPNEMGLDIGIIDVPGHEKFVRHMLAGIGGIDIVLLVIAADEGIMPQTAEHFEILKMLRIPKGIIVLTKTDLVEAEWMKMVREDVAEYVNGTFMESAPVVSVSSNTGENVEELKKVILSMAADCGSRREKRELLRLPVDRVFIVDGFGIVITGTLMEGSVEKGEEVMIYPSGKTAKVRNLQVHGADVEKAAAGQRIAINLTGIKKNEIRRGDVIAALGLLETTRMLDVKINMFSDTIRTLKTGSRLHFYYGSAEVLCKAVLLSEESLEKGQSGYAQLRFEEKIAVKRNDRFILRFYSPMETIGGGIILNAAPGKKKRYDDKAIAALKIWDEGTDMQVLEQLFSEEGSRLTSAETVVKKSGMTWDEAEDCLVRLMKEGILVQLSENIVLHADVVKEMEKSALLILDEFHCGNPLNAGMLKEEFRNKIKTKIFSDDMKKIGAFISMLLKKGSIKEENGLVSAANFSVVYTDSQKRLAALIEDKYKNAGIEAPDIEDVMSIDTDGRMVRQMVEALHRDGKLQRLNYQYYMHTEAFDGAMDILMSELREKGCITLAEFRDMLGTSRKYAMLILDCTDGMKITKMAGEYRVLIK